MKKLLSITIAALAFSGFVHADSQWLSIGENDQGTTWEVKKEGSNLVTHTNGTDWFWTNVRTVGGVSRKTTITTEGVSEKDCLQGRGIIIVTNGKVVQSTYNFKFGSNTVANAVAHSICFHHNPVTFRK